LKLHYVSNNVLLYRDALEAIYWYVYTLYHCSSNEYISKMHKHLQEHLYMCINFHVVYLLANLQCNFLNTQKPSRSTRFSFKKFFLTLSVPEAKLLILFFFYWIVTVLITNTISFVIRNSDRALEKALDFIICSAGGYRTECRMLEENLVDGNTIAGVVLVIVMNTMLTSASWANLFFLIQIQDLKALFKRLSNIKCGSE